MCLICRKVAITSEIIRPKVIQSDTGSKKTSDTSKSTSQPATTTLTSLTAKSQEKAAEELKVEHITRSSPVRKMGETGDAVKFTTNYVRLKAINKGVYQYVVSYDPPIDAQQQRIKMLYNLTNIIGGVRLFDGLTLFLPILLKDQITVAKVRVRQGEEATVTVKITLTKILPPEYTPPPVFNIVFKK